MSGPGLYVEPIRLLARETQVLQMDWTRNRAGCGSMLWITKKKNPTGRGVERKKEMERLLSSFLVYLPYRLPKLGDTHKERDEFGVVDFLSSRFRAVQIRNRPHRLRRRMPFRNKKGNESFSLLSHPVDRKPRTDGHPY